MFAAENLKTADVIAVLVGKKGSIELFWPDAALFQSQCQLARAQTAIDQNIAVTGGNERTVSGAPASEHPQTEHAGCLIELPKIHKRKRENRARFFRLIWLVAAIDLNRHPTTLRVKWRFSEPPLPLA